METIRRILNFQFLDNSVQSWLTALVIIALIYILKRFLSRNIAQLIARLFNKANQSYSDNFLKNVVGPFEFFIFWLVSFITLDKLQFPKVLNFIIFRKLSSEHLLEILSQGVLIISFFRLLIGINYFVGYMIKQKSDKINNRSANQAMALISDIIKVVLVVICLFVLLKVCFNYNISSLLTSLGLVTAALALAAKETVENMISSFIILFDKPFLLGDYVKGNGIAGNIEKIGVRSTRIRTLDKTLVSIPNSALIGGALENVSDQMRRRFHISLELSVETSRQQLQDFIAKIKDIIAKQEGINHDSTVSVNLTQVATQSDKISLEYFCSMQISFAKFSKINEDVNLQIVQAASDLSIDFSNSSSSTVTLKSEEKEHQA